MTNTQTSHRFTIPQTIQTQLKEFYQWHDELKNGLDKLNLRGNEELDHLKIALTKTLFDLLKPNGRLLIGNISPKLSIGTTWAMECLCDWYLIHRTKAQVLAFADSIPENQLKSIEVITEETGVNWFLDIRKR